MVDFGNQLYQIASTIGLALENNQEYAFPKWDYQNYFPNQLPILNNSSNFHDLKETTTGYYKYYFDSNVNYNLQGYFQSYKYFDNYKNIIDNYFKPHVNTEERIINKIAVHIRRTDYLALSHIHLNLTLDYYNKAMSLFPKKEFMIFSDDINWCRDNFKGDQFYFMQPTEAVCDWIFMRKCAGFIIANSSYSWWAAYLAKDKPVVAPDVWALNESSDTIYDRLPKEWERIAV